LIGLIGSFLPYTLFSGEEQMGELMQSFTSISVWLLIATGILKLCVCPLCINLGWRGGNIFPVIFAGISLGYGIALLSGLDPTFCITVLATSVTAAVMRKPVLAVAVLLLCFPVTSIIFMALAGLIGGAVPLPRILRKT
jgi:H+/Cl- antiporter ClcA